MCAAVVVFVQVRKRGCADRMKPVRGEWKGNVCEISTRFAGAAATRSHTLTPPKRAPDSGARFTVCRRDERDATAAAGGAAVRIPTRTNARRLSQRLVRVPGVIQAPWVGRQIKGLKAERLPVDIDQAMAALAHALGEVFRSDNN